MWDKKNAIKINSISHLKELCVLPPLPGVFSININIFPPSVISHASSSQNPFTGPKLLFSWLTKILLDSKAFSLSRTPTALKGMCLKALTVRLSQSQPPLSDRMHCAMKMMNGVWRCYRVLFLTAGDGSCTGCLYSSREATKQGGSALFPRSHSTSVGC